MLLCIAVASGTILTLTFDRGAGLPARLCMGTAIGLALLATVGFAFGWWLGLNPASIDAAAVMMLLPWLLLFSRGHRESLRSELHSAVHALTHPRPSELLLFLPFFGLTVLLGLIFSRAMFTRADGIYTGVTNNLGDLPFHLQVISSFAYGQNNQAEDPTFAGVRFGYPFMADYLSAMLARLGASLQMAMWLPNMLLALSFIGLLVHWTKDLTGSRMAAWIAPLLVLFNGGFGWWQIFQDVRNSDHGLLPLLANLPHDYTITQGVPDAMYRWGNSLTTLLVPQRSILFGLPLALFICQRWWSVIRDQESRSSGNGSFSRTMVAAGVTAGMLPLIHAHTFLVVMVVGVCLAAIFGRLWRKWMVFYATSLLVAAPELVWLSHTSAANTRAFFAWSTGWDHGTHNAVWFWFVNTGLFIPILIIALIQGLKNGSRKILLFYAPFFLCFIVPNLVRLAPWMWDNIKILFYWYIASVPLVAGGLARWLEEQTNPRRRWVAAGLLVLLCLSGGLDVLRVITHAEDNREFDTNDIVIAKVISDVARPNAVVLDAPNYASPIFLTGRRCLLGYPSWSWSRGLDYGKRETDIRKMYAGGLDAEQLLQQYRVEYALVSLGKTGSLEVSETFWKHYRRIATVDGYRLYKIGNDQ